MVAKKKKVEKPARQEIYDVLKTRNSVARALVEAHAHSAFEWRAAKIAQLREVQKIKEQKVNAEFEKRVHAAFGKQKHKVYFMAQLGLKGIVVDGIPMQEFEGKRYTIDEIAVVIDELFKEYVEKLADAHLAIRDAEEKEARKLDVLVNKTLRNYYNEQRAKVANLSAEKQYKQPSYRKLVAYVDALTR